jgi:NAD-dependent deacetylase
MREFPAPPKPNAAHFALARLEAALTEKGGNVFLCTQNIDDLHERAGTRKVIHLHDNLLKARCPRCEVVSTQREDLGVAVPCPSCPQVGGLRPHVVRFNEIALEMHAICDACAKPISSPRSALQDLSILPQGS